MKSRINIKSMAFRKADLNELGELEVSCILVVVQQIHNLLP